MDRPCIAAPGLLALAMLAAVAAPSSSSAQRAEASPASRDMTPAGGSRRARATGRRRARPPEHRHEGPQVRVSLGAGGIYAYQSLDGGTDEISGTGTQFSLAVGEMVSETLALQLDLAVFHASEAESSLFESVAFTAVNVGIGATYWWLPYNVYVSAALGLASSSVEEGAIRIVEFEIPEIEVSSVGAGLHLSGGKLWWISQWAGFGVTGSVLAMEMPAGSGDNVGPRLLVSGVLALTLSYR